MPKESNDTMRFVISFRVNHEEKEALSLLAEKSGVSISNLIRENLNLTEEDSRFRCVSA